MAITWNRFQNITGSALTFNVLRTNRIKNISSHLFPIFVLLRWSRNRILVHSKAAQCILSLRIYRIMDLSIFAISPIHLFRCFTLITTCFTCSNISLGSSSNEKLKKNVNLLFEIKSRSFLCLNCCEIIRGQASPGHKTDCQSLVQLYLGFWQWAAMNNNCCSS